MADESRPLLSAFSFVSVLISYFAAGLLFLVLTVPLLCPFLASSETSSPILTLGGLVKTWLESWNGYLKAQDSGRTALLHSFLVLLFGFSVQPIAATYVSKSGKNLRRILRRYGLNAIQNEMYDPIGRTATYGEFTAWLHKHTAEKSAWEWEFFHYYLSCGIAFNMACLLLAAIIRDVIYSNPRSFPLRLLSVLLVSSCYTLYHAWSRSQVQQSLYMRYYDEFRKATLPESTA